MEPEKEDVNTDVLVQSLDRLSKWLESTSVKMSTEAHLIQNLINKRDHTDEVREVLRDASFFNCYEDGMSSPVDDLEEVMGLYGLKIVIPEIMKQVTDYICRGNHNEMCGHVFRFLGRQSYSDDVDMGTEVRFFLERVMLDKSQTVVLRDEASVGLSNLDSAESIPAFKQAIEQEEGYFRDWLKKILEQLERHQAHEKEKTRTE